MLDLADYLDLTPQAATAQLLAISRREQLPAGKRQEDFTPVETLLCYGLGLIGNRSTSGNINIPESSPDAQRLGQMFKRSPGSLALKLANLDGRRANGAKHEQQLWIKLTEDRYRYEALYALILEAGRSLGLNQAEFPDFLGFEDDRLQIVFEADTVSDDDLYLSLEEVLLCETIGDDVDIRDTERALLGTARVGQQQFARKVLTNAGFACVFCGLSARAAGLPSARMLVASHIKPWRSSAGSERIDPRNGLAACPTHDAAFEAYLFSVDARGHIVRSETLNRAIDMEPSWRHNFGALGLALKLIMSPDGHLPSRRYTDWHNSQVSALVNSPPRKPQQELRQPNTLDRQSLWKSGAPSIH